MKILIVEDEVLIREGMSDYLMECGYGVFEAGDGQGGPGPLFTEKPPDLVLLDIQLPILNGLEVPQDHPEDQLSPCPHADGLPWWGL